MHVIIAALLWIIAGAAFAQEVAAQPAPMDPFSYILHALSERWPWLVQLGAMAVAVQIALRGVADLLLLVSAKTETKVDDKAAQITSQASWYLGVLIGKMGWGTPKAVLEEKAKEMANVGATKPEPAAGEAPKAG